ncbi:transposase family protein [Streptomyces roseolus]|uniref:transposase family protein n=1 Tax=Streptomyces roseolus TaxID=67358 RepID=UPI0037BB62AC
MITSNRRITGLSADVVSELIAEVGPLGRQRRRVRLSARPRKRAVGAGAKHRLVFVDRLLAALVPLRHGVTHDVPACRSGVDRSTVTRAIGEVRPLLAERGCTVGPDVRLRPLAEAVDRLGAGGKTCVIDGTEIRARRPAVGRKGRDGFLSGENKQNAVKSMGVTDDEGRVPWCSPTVPGSRADITHARRSGLVQLLADGPPAEILADAGPVRVGSGGWGYVESLSWRPRSSVPKPVVGFPSPGASALLGPGEAGSADGGGAVPAAVAEDGAGAAAEVSVEDACAGSGNGPHVRRAVEVGVRGAGDRRPSGGVKAQPIRLCVANVVLPS